MKKRYGDYVLIDSDEEASDEKIQFDVHRSNSRSKSPESKFNRLHTMNKHSSFNLKISKADAQQLFRRPTLNMNILDQLTHL